ncbi:unnamed protein product [Sphenostylis stenocarpa]|uniref:Uncharacterized protein n=1 Tax=Sphenostylis stenocarpa TaxID=92480 RepID=A0AA86V4Y3_9FABA|nr:unnamed protein product [Sphenostylis stenocarpa]
MEAQFDDDTFYAEIRRQILQLTSEDEEDLLVVKPFNQASVGGSTRLAYNRTSPHANHFCSWETQSSSSADLPVNLWKSGRGTGVFIPQVVTGKKYQRPGTMNGRKQIYKAVANKY